MFMTSNRKLPTDRLAMSPHTRFACCVLSRGPGRMPHIMKPANTTAVVAVPGTPSASKGAKPRTEAALFAHSVQPSQNRSPPQALGMFGRTASPSGRR